MRAREDPQYRERLLLLTLAAIQFTHVLDFMVLMPLGPQLMRLFEIGPAQFGLLVSAYTLSAAAAGFACALYIDRFDRRHALLALYTGFAVATLLCALAPGFGLLLAARVCAGAFGGVVGATVYSIVGDAIPAERRGAATGMVASAFSVAAVAGVPIGLFLANQFSWRGPFAFLTLLCTFVLFAIARWVPALRTHLAHHSGQSPWRRIGRVLAEPGHLRALAVMAALMMAGFSVIPFLSPYLVANTGMRETQLPYLYFCGGLATVFTSRLSGRLADRHGKARMFVLVSLLSVVPILMVTNLPPVPAAVSILVTTLFMVFSNGRWVCALAMVTGSVSPQLRGSFLNLSFAVQQLASSLASFAAGLIIGQTASGALSHYWVVGLLAAVATLAAVALGRKLTPRG